MFAENVSGVVVLHTITSKMNHYHNLRQRKTKIHNIHVLTFFLLQRSVFYSLIRKGCSELVGVLNQNLG